MPNSATSNNLFNATQLAEVITQAAQILHKAGLDNAPLEARWLIGDTLKLNRTDLMASGSRILTAEEISRIKDNLQQRCQHKPLARIVGEREFWGLPFGLNEATLEPRPDSETLIETTLKQFQDHNIPLRILDLGTGTGCLLCSLLHEFPQAHGLGIDIAPRAIGQAALNAKQLNLSERAQFKVGDWLQSVEGKFDVIISNPPYIESDVVPTLMPEVRDYDPIKALDGGKDGLTVYKHLIPQLHSYLTHRGIVVFEVGYDQAASVSRLLTEQKFSVSIIKDLGGKDRCVLAT